LHAIAAIRGLIQADNDSHLRFWQAKNALQTNFFSHFFQRAGGIGAARKKRRPAPVIY